MTNKASKSKRVQAHRHPQLTMRAGGYTLVLGTVPKVVGTLFSLSDGMLRNARDLACDIIEVRLDQMPRQKDWLARCLQIEATGMPVILTVRHQKEGGKWRGTEAKRLEIYSKALNYLAAVDVEFSSSIRGKIATLARRRGKVCILSHHNFAGTTGLPKLRRLVKRAWKFGAIPKIAMVAKRNRDHFFLRLLVHAGTTTPMCLLGMGPTSGLTRISYPKLGSCLTYGYLDVPAAPGQPFAPALVAKLREVMPQYDKEFATRKLQLQVPREDWFQFSELPAV